MNNAGGAPAAQAATVSPRFSTKIVQLNLLAPLFVGQAANRVMQTQDGGGSIVNISSLAGIQGVGGAFSYTASKFAVRGMTKVAAIEFGPAGIRVNSIHPGGIETPMTRIKSPPPPGRLSVMEAMSEPRTQVSKK